MNKKKAPFITFEGGEGSGKSTQAELLYKELLNIGIDVAAYREPGGTKGSEEIRELLMHGDSQRWTHKSEALLMSAARAELVEKKIVPHLEKGTWVVCDRFVDSTIAYQGFGHNLTYQEMDALNHFTVGNLVPDLTFIFQLPPEVGLERAAVREGGVRDRYESFDLNFHRRVTEGYAEILRQNPGRCVAINALLDIDMITQQVWEKVKQFCKL